MKKGFFLLIVCLFSISLLTRAQDIAWDFTADNEGWNPYGDDVTTSHSGSNLVVTYTGGGDGAYGYTTIYNTVSIDASKIDKFYMKFTAHNWVKTSVFVNITLEISGTTYYANQTMTVANGEFTFDIRDDVQNKWNNLPATGTITQIRIEIPHSSETATASDWNGATLDIDRIAFSKSLKKMAHWSFDANYTDDIRTIAGTVNGNPAISASAKKGAGALALDGVGSYLRMAANPVFSSPDITYSFWMKTPAAGQTWPGAARIFSTPSSAGFELGILNGNICFLGDGGWSNFVMGWQNDVWAHIALVVKGNDVSCYVNGTQSGATLTATKLDRSGDFLLGSNGGEAVIASFDELSIFNYALSQAEILVEAGIVADNTPPVLSAVTSGTVKEGTAVSVTSDEVGTVYLVPAGTAKVKADILAASVATASASAGVAAGLSTAGIAAGSYIVYAIDATGNVSDASASITVEFRDPVWNFTASAEGWHDLGGGRDVAASWDNGTGSLKMTYIDGAPAQGPGLWFPAVQVDQAFDASTHRYLEVYYETVGWPTTAPVKMLVQCMNGKNEAVYSYVDLDPTKNFASIDVAAFDPGWGKIYTGLMKTLYLELPTGSPTPVEDWFGKSTLIHKVELTNTQTADIAPVLSAVTAGTVSVGDAVSATSNAAATVYLVPAGTAKVKADILAAAVANAAATANVAVTISTTGIALGNYIVYAIGATGKVSDASASITVKLSDPVWDFASDMQGWHDLGAGRDVAASWENGSLKMSYFDGTPDPAQGPQLYAPGVQVEKVFDASTHRYMEIAYTSVNWPVTTPVQVFLILTNNLDQVSYVLGSLDPNKNFASIDLTTGWGNAYGGMIKSIQIEFPFGGDAAATPAANWFGKATLIDKIEFTNTQTDHVAPVLSAVTAGTIIAGGDISATSSEDATVYLAPAGTAKVKADILAAAVANAAATANVAVTVSTTGIALGDYIVYAIDAADNVSDASASITISAPDVTAPVLSAVTAGTITAGGDISATSSEDATVYLAPAGTAKVKADILAAAVANAAATANVAVTLSTTGIALGDYIVYAIDAAGNVSDASASITISAPDITAPVLSAVTAGTITAGGDISATSSEDATVYLVPAGTAKVKADILAAAVANAAATADVAVTLSTTGIALGNYIVYAIDAAGNVSDASASITVIVAPIPQPGVWEFTTDTEGWNPYGDDVTTTHSGSNLVVTYTGGSDGVYSYPTIYNTAPLEAANIDKFYMKYTTHNWVKTSVFVNIVFEINGTPYYGNQTMTVVDGVEGEFTFDLRDDVLHAWNKLPATGAITMIRIEIPNELGSPSNWNGATLDIDRIVFSKTDKIAPVLSNITTGPIISGDNISVTSDEDATVYLVPAGTAKVKAAILAAALVSNPATATVAVNLNTAGITAGNFIVYAIDATGNVSDASTSITIGEPDITAPVLSDVTTGSVSIGINISATSNEGATVYLVPEGTAKVKAEILAAAVSNASAAAGVAAMLSTTGITAGNYIVYAIDGADNVSDASASITVKLKDPVWDFTTDMEGWHDMGAGRDVAASWENGFLKMSYIDGAPTQGPQLWFAAIEVAQEFDAGSYPYIHIIYTTVGWPTTSPVHVLITFKNSNDELVYAYASLDPEKTSAIIDIASVDPTWGKKYTGMMKSIQIELPHNGDPASSPATAWFGASTLIDKIEMTNSLILGTKNLINEPVSIYPNPASKSFNVTGTDVDKISIYNLSGKLVKVQKNTSRNITVEGLVKGLYMVKIESKGVSVMKKLIVE
jgi:hypothetical protein